ncbi:MAG: polysaccharide pyruvyl transferase family protein, partial [Oscillibacter sp.]|nr:polysaccharide pyruvyl transferase family protein [Oscillibacter sp.]
MKTGLLTFYHIHHYGAALQAAALTREVERLGGTCEIIDYYVRQNNALFRVPTSPAAAASDLHTALHYLPLRRRYQRFEAFQREHLHLTDRRYKSMDQMRDLSYDVLLCGSDQIWNPTIFPDGQFDPVFFGTFSPARKAAYAPSFGISEIPEEMRADLKKYLAPFSHLSVRETAGQSVLRDLTGREAALVLDPTLLPDAEAWEELANYPAGYPEGAYVLCYCISRPGVLAPYVRALARQTGLPVVQLCGVRRKAVPGARCILDAGPAEFLGLFQHAAAVVTNSFHGTAFALQFHKPFFSAVSPRELADPSNARTYGLLRRLGLEDRVAGTGGTASPGTEIDWEAVDRTLASEREKSRTYLAEALSGQRRSHLIPPQALEKEAKEKGQPPVLASHETCTGCTACFNICPRSAIAMERDREGFLRPVIDEAACIRCGRCAAVCPILHKKPAAAAAPAVFAAWNRDEAVRRDSSSGGVFTALA